MSAEASAEAVRRTSRRSRPFIPAGGDFLNAELLGTPNQQMIGNVIQAKFLESLDYPTAAALSFVLMAAILVSLLVYARIVGSEKLTG